tara:strand:+ start:19559 stop:19786 length:228 start_codon:yes stop_codon:yes gene_type:complete
VGKVLWKRNKKDWDNNLTKMTFSTPTLKREKLFTKIFSTDTALSTGSKREGGESRGIYKTFPPLHSTNNNNNLCI